MVLRSISYVRKSRPSDINIGSFSFYIIAMTIPSLAEICIAHLVFSTITKYADPRYLAIINSLAFIPGLIFRAITSQLYSTFYDNDIELYAGYVLLAILLMGVTIYFLHPRMLNFWLKAKEKL